MSSARQTQEQGQPVAGAAAARTAIFLHIPKTAGTTLSRIVERQYPRRHTYTIMETTGPHSGRPQDFAQLPDAQRASIRLVKGHVAFGIHRTLPTPFTYFTMLREPTARVLSHYAHARRDPQHNLYPSMQKMTLAEALAQKAHVAMAFDNFQTRLISGIWNTVPFGMVDEDMLERAKEHLRRYFAVVGLVERFDESLLLLQLQFGWRAVYYTRHNTSAPHYNLEAHPANEQTLQLIRRHNRLDDELYRFAADRCAQQIAQAGPRFRRRLRRFQTINQIVSPCLRLYWRARKVSLRTAFSRR